jgi:cytochrome c biogenesis protein CcdA
VDHLILAWYGWLSGLTQGAVFGLQGVADGLALPVASAVIFGLIGATSPCQLTTNLGALAYVAARGGDARPFGMALAYVAGKVSVYSVIGAAVIVAGLQLQATSIPVILVARKALGPLMVIVGLMLAGAWRPRVTLGQALSLRLRECLPVGGRLGAYLLGVAFAFAFCPTLFWLFFGLTVPLALRSGGGWAFPGLFALGSSVPLLVVAALLGASVGAVHRIVGGVRRWERPVRLVAALVLVVAGLHDTAVYWLL